MLTWLLTLTIILSPSGRTKSSKISLVTCFLLVALEIFLYVKDFYFERYLGKNNKRTLKQKTFWKTWSADDITWLPQRVSICVSKSMREKHGMPWCGIFCVSNKQNIINICYSWKRYISQILFLMQNWYTSYCFL